MSLNERTINNQSISVVMITLNEEAAIAKVVRDIKEHCPQCEVVVVDSSKDKTAEIANELGCKVVKQFPPQGYGPAMHQAFKNTTREYIVTMDCDNTYPVEAIKLLVAKGQEGYDLVSASRLRQRPKNMPLANYLANCIFAFCARLVCGVSTTDVHTGMRLYKKSMLENFPYEANGPALPVELQIGPSSIGFKSTEIFIDYHPRIGESKLQRFASTVWTFKRIWKWRRFFNKRRNRSGT